MKTVRPATALGRGVTAGGGFRHGRATSVVHHFHEKLLGLHGEMLTDMGRRIALERTRRMREYLDALREELGLSSF